MTPYSLVYVTTANQDQALAIARTVVEERLAACGNVLGTIQSVYWWEGKLEQDTEAALVLKTRAELVEALVERVRALHSYSCPCVVALPITAGNGAFLDWIGAETKR